MNPCLCIFGEVLFDHFPSGERVLGGAPFNVAWHLQAFGLATHFISRVGDDEEGRQVLQAMRDWNMDTSGVQLDSEVPTGRVSVSFDAGEPSYDIVAPCAYDRIAIPSPLPRCDLLYHGSLALRDPASRSAAEAILADAGRIFLDVNLRPPWWQREQVLALVGRAHWVKLNEHELADLSGGDTPDTQRAQAFLREHDLQGLVVTRGAAGAEMLSADGQSHRVKPQMSGKTVDTVGAGDAFASVLLLGIARQWPPPLILERAQAFASVVVGQRGATIHDAGFYRQFIDQWQS